MSLGLRPMLDSASLLKRKQNNMMAPCLRVRGSRCTVPDLSLPAAPASTALVRGRDVWSRRIRGVFCRFPASWPLAAGDLYTPGEDHNEYEGSSTLRRAKR